MQWNSSVIIMRNNWCKPVKASFLDSVPDFEAEKQTIATLSWTGILKLIQDKVHTIKHW